MKSLYLDIFSGISGDMFLGAMVDLGLDVQRLDHELAKLHLDGFHLHVSRAKKSGIEGVKFDVHLGTVENEPLEEHSAHVHHHSHPHLDHPQHKEKDHRDHRTFKNIEMALRRSELSDWVKDKAVSVFRRIAVAEGKIHGQPTAEVHFHEVGALDSIVDIAGACIALELLGKPRVWSSPVIEGTGWVDCAHGHFPVPAPAVLEILSVRGIAITQCEEPHELVTPTGAALLAEFAESFGPMTNLVADRIGYGLGTRDNHTRPNVLRVVLGEMANSPSRFDPGAADHLDWEKDTIAVLETNLDDINPEFLGHFVEEALSAGALDVFHTPIQMKKNRPAVLLTVLCANADADRFSKIILRETSAFGVRRTFAERRKLRREVLNVETPFGTVQIKVGKLNGRVVQIAPEFESCRAAARNSSTTVRQVYEAAEIAAASVRNATPGSTTRL